MDSIAVNEAILAVVALEEKRDSVGGGVPIFYAKDEEEREKTALFISKVLRGMVHDLENGIYVIVKH